MIFLQTVLFAAAPLIALTNPVGEMPIFLSIVEGRDRAQAHAAAVRVALGVWTILCLSAVIGLQLLGLLGIELSAFRAAGGLLLVVMGLEMLRGHEPEARTARRDPEDADDALWVPLTMPLLAGPGSIVVAVGLTVRDPYRIWWVPLATVIAISLAAVLVYMVLAIAAVLGTRIHARGVRILTRFSGLILVAAGFQMGFTGIAEFFGL